MLRPVFLLTCLLLVFSVGCSEEKAASSVATGLDQQTIEAYQAQSEGDGYDNYVEPK